MLTRQYSYLPPKGSSPPSDTTYVPMNLTWENAPDLWVQAFDFSLMKLLVGNIDHSAIQFVSVPYVGGTMSLTQRVRNGEAPNGTAEVHTGQDDLSAMAC